MDHYFSDSVHHFVLLHDFRFVNFLVYFGLTYNTVSLAGSVYVNFLISGLSELNLLLRTFADLTNKAVARKNSVLFGFV